MSNKAQSKSKLSYFLLLLNFSKITSQLCSQVTLLKYNLKYFTNIKNKKRVLSGEKYHGWKKKKTHNGILKTVLSVGTKPAVQKFSKHALYQLFKCHCTTYYNNK